MILYHIDRQKKLTEGQIIRLFDDYSLEGPRGREICEYIRNLYPDGISEHGNRYLFDNKNENWKLETFIENSRLHQHPTYPSRFQSFFAVSKDYIPQMLNKLNTTYAFVNIFEIDTEKYSIHDMSLLDELGFGAGVVHYNANRYWKGEKSDRPLLEYLVPLPVTIGKMVFLSR